MKPAVLLIAVSLLGCAGAVYGPALDLALAKCRQEARDAKASGMPSNLVINVYEKCKIREGVF